MSWATGSSAGGWPPPGEPVSGAGLPEGATLVHRVPVVRALLVVLAPAFLLVAYGRFLALGIPASRLFNPGVYALTGAAMVVLGLLFLPRGGRSQVAAGPDWVARRASPVSRWRVVPLSSVDRYSLRRYATRGPRMTSLRLLAADGRPVAFAAPEGEAWLDRLAETVAGQGAQQVDAGPFDGLGTGGLLKVLAAVLVVALVPLPYLLAGPLRVLPPGVAGWFSSSGCRAALAAARQQDPVPPTSWAQTLQAGSSTWRLVGQVPATVAQAAGATADPAARLAHLRTDAATGGYQLTYQGPDGSLVAVDAITFASPAGATDYLHYVDRATCERFAGASGPAPGEVRWRSGRTYGMARWVAASTVYAVSPVLAEPEATREEVDDLAAAAQAGAGR